MGWRNTLSSIFFFNYTLTSDIETHFPFDFAIGISDGVTSLVGTCDSAESDVAFIGADAALVAVSGQSCTGQQHQSRSAGWDGKEDELHFTEIYVQSSDFIGLNDI